MTIDPKVMTTVGRCIEEARGREVCGYLTLDQGTRQEFHRVTNRSTELDNFWISRTDYRRFMRKVSRQNLQILGFVHSHQSSLELSRQDKISLNNSEVPWIVVTIADSQLLSKVYYPEHLSAG
jgi:proteasome lid subunit RPN8/RPN11